MIQYRIKAALNKFGDSGEKAVVKELNQLHDMKNIFPVDPKELSHEERVKTVGSLMF